jgi:GR25 family glycosyltransferase involved in LPS biosynthesis
MLITYYVIHLNTNLQRKLNIEKQEKKLGQTINKFNAILGSEIDTNSYTNLIFNFKYKSVNELGCYLSHFSLLNIITEVDGYTVIFEDDFTIENTLHEKIINILSLIEIDFDLLFLGDIVHNNKGVEYKDPIYFVDKKSLLWGSHGYIVKNKNINKIIQNILTIDLPIDTKYKFLINNNTLIGLIIKPSLVHQNNSIQSTIREKNLM